MENKRSEVSKEIAHIICATELGEAIAGSYKAEDINSMTKLVDDLGLDSLDIQDLACRLEDHYGIIISPSILEDLETVGDFADVVILRR